jgi:murein DD-endopeptidase MepM/ murein hydrolase activator NlpD
MIHRRVLIAPAIAAVLLLIQSQALHADQPQHESVGWKIVFLQIERQYREPLEVAERLFLPERAEARIHAKTEVSGATQPMEPPGMALSGHSLFSVLGSGTNTEQTASATEPVEPAPPEERLVQASPPRPPAPQPQVTRPSGVWGWQWPTRSRLITDAYGVPRGRGYHGGMDIADRWKAPVSAIAPGVVVFAGNEGATYGLSVVIQHPNGWLSRYGHLSGVYPRAGDRVTGGQPIGQMGDSGYAFGTHLHLEVIANGRLIDPLSILPR